MVLKQNCVMIWIKIAEDVETRFDTSTYKLDRPLPKGKSRKLIEKRITSKNRDRICCIESKNL